MSTAEFLARLRSLAVQLWLDGDQLRYDAPAGVMTPALRADLGDRKAEIMALLVRARLESLPQLPPIRPATCALEPAPSFAQNRLLFLATLRPESTEYNLSRAFRLTGALDIAALEQSLNEIVSRHQVLRTSFDVINGNPVQRIAPVLHIPLRQEDLSQLDKVARTQRCEALIQQEYTLPFDLNTGPLLRATLVRLGDEDHMFLLGMHHIVYDGWSLGVIFRELRALYAAFAAGRESPLQPLPVQYADYAQWQREWLQGDVLEGHLKYWRNQLKALSILELPTDHVRPVVQGYAGRAVSLRLPRELSEKLRAFSQREGVTPFMLLLAVFVVLLHRYSGQTDIVLGSPVANRNRSELEGLIGFFVNMLVLRTDVGGNPGFRELLGQVREVALGAYEHQDLPFEKLVAEIDPERDTSRAPLLQVVFALQNAPMGALELEHLNLDSMPSEVCTTRFDLEAHLFEAPAGLEVNFIYNRELFEQVTVERMLGHYRQMLEAALAEPARCIGDLELLSARERRQVLQEWNHTATDYPRGKTVHALFEEQVALAPDAVAVEYEGDSLSYVQLNERANQLVHYLRARGVGSGTMVGVFLEPSLEMIVALLGILKAGGAYVPVDIDYPSTRIVFMLEDARVAALLTTSNLTGRLPDLEGERICLDSERAKIEQESADNPEVTASAENLAYVIYTSGSTGTPKGVEIPHRAINRLVRNTDYYQIDATDHIAQASNVSFDAATFEIWGALLNGAQLIGINREVLLNSKSLADFLEQKHITAMFITTAVFNQIAREAPWAFRVLKGLMFGGEAVDCNAVRQVLANHPPERLLHVYGPTESTTFSSWYQIEAVAADATTVPIGRPISNTTVYVLDKQMNPVPVGVHGELYIGGDGLARGYLNQPELTAEKFVAAPFSEDPQVRLYATGDKVRYRPDGSIEFIGRFDDQIKLRGFRVELGEIETALVEHSAVQDAVAIVREDEPGDKRIAAYVVPSSEWVEQITSNQSGEHVEEWQALYEETYRDIDASQDLTSNFTGWNSSYTGEPIPLAEMTEWMESTVARIAALQPKRVLEIGCGTGLLLYRLASACERYVGTDFSAVAQQQVKSVVTTRDTFNNVELWQRMADDFSDVEAGDFDTVIINSVTQYLPSMDYLAAVIEGAIGVISDGGSIMLGDIRSLPLLKSYHTSVQCYLSPDEASRGELLRNIQQHVEEENELVIEPAFFHALKQRIARLSHVEILLKQGRYHNELTGYRYDVLLHVEAQSEALPDDGQWLDWGASGLEMAQLQARLKEADQDWFGINAIPNARIAQDVAVLEQLQGEGSALSVGELRQSAESTLQQAIEPDALWRLAEKTGYRLELSYTGAGTDGRMDALFRRRRREDCAGHVFWPQRQAVPERAWSAYGTNPLKGRLGNELIPRLRQDLQQDLPEYMLPSVYVVLDALPLNSNGKVDRKALPLPGDVRASLGAEYTAPRTGLEQQLAQIWSEVLKLERVGVHDNFFDLGGHSLMATQVVSRIRGQLNVELPLSGMFGYPTVAELAPVVAVLVDEAGDEVVEAIPIADRSGDLPLSFAQERLWFLDQMEPGNAAYNMPMALRLKGELSVTALINALNAIVQRHEALRTRFVNSQNGPLQHIDEQVSFDLLRDDLSEFTAEARDKALEGQLQAEAIRPFDLASDLLLRGILLRLGEHDHVLLLTMHHIISDGWSLGVLFREMGEYYGAFSGDRLPQLADLPIQYADFAAWQRDCLSGTQLDKQLAYWRRQLADLPTLNLPTDYPRPPVQTYAGAQMILPLDNRLSAQLESLSKQTGATLFMTLLGAFAVMMQRYSGQDDVVIGSPIANRNRSELENLIAFFVNMLTMRVDCSGNPGFREFLEQVSAMVLSTYEHQDIPFEKLVDALQVERDSSRNPLFQVTFALQNAPMEKLELEGLTLESVGREVQKTRFDLECHCWKHGNGIEVIFIYNTDLFEAATIQRMMDHYHHLLESAIADPDQAIDFLPMLHEDEKHVLLEQWNQTSQNYPRGITLQQLFSAQVERNPASIAVEFGGEALSYAELDARSNQLAGYLRALGVGAEVLVGLYLERSVELVVGILGILKAGGAYVPLDSEYPRARLAFMLEDTRLPVLLTQNRFREELPDMGAQLVCLDSGWGAIAEHGEDNLSVEVDAENLAYVLYTSGSTGRPKGVAVPHRAACNHMLWMQAAFPLSETDRVLQKTPFSFDASVWEFFAPLIAGARLVMARPQAHKDPHYLANAIAEQQITRIQLVPSLLKLLLDEGLLEGCASLRHVFCGGEALLPELQQRFFACHGAELCNLYGPTEATIDAIVWQCDRQSQLRIVPIGRPIANTQVYILDRHRQPVPVGVAGEIYIGGAGLARGYLNRAELTAERFIEHPFSDRPEARLYQTGDLARYLPDGIIEYLGRTDHQVKLRGFRIELGEIESALTSQEAVRDAAAIVREDEPGNQRLAAYVVPAAAWIEQLSSSHSSEHVSEWQALYEETYGKVDAALDLTTDFTGWNSSYTHESIPLEEMEEWLDATIARITSLQPKRVLEIGCGSGLLLYRLAPDSERYVGADFSAAAQQQVRDLVGANDSLNHVELWQRTADDFGGIETGDFDTVVINSVVQYFPSMDYLLEVLSGAVAGVTAGGQVFVGDVRSFALLTAYHTSVEAYRAQDNVTGTELLRSVQQHVEEENELVIEPAFFQALRQRIPRISDVEILLKQGEHVNELSAFRYDVILHVEAQGQPLSDSGEWYDWGRSDFSESQLEDMLRQQDRTWLGINAIPNRRVVGEIALLEQLQGDGLMSPVGELKQNIATWVEQAIDPASLWRLAEKCGCELELSYTGSGVDGRMDALFRPSTRADCAGKVFWPQEETVEERKLADFGSSPLKGKLGRELIPRLKDDLRESLPEYMLPSVFVVLDGLPLTANGKVNRRALPVPGDMRVGVDVEYVAPRNEVEEKMAQIWQEVLKLGRVGLHDNFFDLGGHSLMATQVVSRMRDQMQIDMPLSEIFGYPTIAELAQEIETIQWINRDAEEYLDEREVFNL